MATPGGIQVTPGTGPVVADYQFTDSDTVARVAQRVALNDSGGKNLGGDITDVAAANFDGTAISWTSIFKQISKSVQAAAASLAGTLAAAVTAVSGAFVDGAIATLGTNADAAVSTDASGTVNAHIRGLVKIFAAALSAAGALFFKITDGTNTAAVKAASTAPGATDPSLVVAPSPNAIDFGSGTGGSHTQRMLIDSSQLSNLGPATAANGAPIVTPTDAAPIQVAVSPTVTASAYTAGNIVGGLLTFSGIGRAPNSSGIIQDVTMTCKTVQTTEFDLYLFNANPSNSTWTDKTAPAINAADVNKVIGVIKLTKNYSGLGTHTLYKPDETTWAPMVYSGATLYGVLIAISTPTFGSTSDVTVTLGSI